MLSSLLASSLEPLRQQSANLQTAAASDGMFNWLEPCTAVLNHVFSWDFTDAEAKVSKDDRQKGYPSACNMAPIQTGGFHTHILNAVGLLQRQMSEVLMNRLTGRELFRG